MEQDYRKAETWLRAAAEAGDSYAQFHLGGMHNEGKGVKRDQAEAAKWFLRAAQAGNVKARTSIALFYMDGISVDQDYEKAYAWASLAAFQGSDKARHIAARALCHIRNRSKADALALTYFDQYGVRDPYADSSPDKDSLHAQP